MGDFYYVGNSALRARCIAGMRSGNSRSCVELKAKIVEATPKQSGDLAATTRVISTRVEGNMVIGGVEQGGGPAEEYTVIVHSKWSRRGGGGPARQVEGPLLAHRGRHVVLIASGVKRALR